ncbi:SUMO-activating enzyme subunit 2-like [Paramacrobiotus metropolitanus]|uniref:SUMO-activating enzyme subunit 2-like n=1 Tax=Paramacrobiotus metropolitanus TaxID=2943436 RepID=UPI002445C7F0|nr:SUMO-activating enzyme subunit 2-like [Paramacrobiotus metropolitanus]
MAFDPETAEKIHNAKIFMVGAGGIGCELLKNLLLTGFRNVELIDLDTIEVSNLNRQFLFRSEHVGKPKAEVAATSALEMCPEAKITWHHDSIMKPRFNVKFFSQFDIVMNALDNVTARSHVNRMCLAANVPLIESGSSGYLGNCRVIIKGKTECFDCVPPVPQKTFPGCTIRNTPSEPIHCIVWAKHLFNQLFGEADPDQDVSPDTADPEVHTAHAANGFGDTANGSNGENVQHKSVSTRSIAEACGYNPIELFQKLFNVDIKYLLSMDKLWEGRRKAPVPLNIHELLKHAENLPSVSAVEGQHEDKQVWSMKENAQVFMKSVNALKATLKQLETLVWDKDDENSMDFVTACANLRAHCFGIAVLSRFDIKQMAGNIIPAIASTNAMVAGFIIFNAIKLLQAKSDECRVVINKVFRDVVPAVNPKRRDKIVNPTRLQEPVKGCLSCADHVEIGIAVNVKIMTIKEFQDTILKGYLKMTAPDVELDDSSGRIIISSEDEGLKNRDKPLNFFGVEDGTRLNCEDFLQEYEIKVTISHVEELPDGKLFVVTGDLKQMEEVQQQAIAEPQLGKRKADNQMINSNKKLGMGVQSPEEMEVID